MVANSNISLLAPAGSFESLQAAIQAGANAVYFGVEQLNMRARSAGGFVVEDLKTISTICKKAGIQSYITLNTVMYEHDMQLLQVILKEVKNQKIDATIAADFARDENFWQATSNSFTCFYTGQYQQYRSSSVFCNFF
jgi:putative protease